MREDQQVRSQCGSGSLQQVLTRWGSPRAMEPPGGRAVSYIGLVGVEKTTASARLQARPTGLMGGKGPAGSCILGLGVWGWGAEGEMSKPRCRGELRGWGRCDPEALHP